MMKKLLLISLFALLIVNEITAQSYYPYQEVPLSKPQDFRAAEPFAMSASDFLLTTPFKEKDKDRERAFNFLVNWTAGASDYNFGLYGVIMEAAEDKNLMTLYIPAMAKFCLENKTVGTNLKLIEAGATRMVLAYCNDPRNNFKLKKKYRKRMELL